MRVPCRLALALVMLGVFASAGAVANNIRGQILAASPIAASGSMPVGGVTVQLTRDGPGGLTPADETDSTSDGYYFFFKVTPGDYVLVVNGKLQFPLRVGHGDEQDIPPILIPD